MVYRSKRAATKAAEKLNIGVDNKMCPFLKAWCNRKCICFIPAGVFVTEVPKKVATDIVKGEDVPMVDEYRVSNPYCEHFKKEVIDG